jgi:hypothetical protein
MTDVALYNLDAKGVVKFSFKACERLVSGPEEALQIVAYHMFTSQGSNAFDRDEGGGINEIAGSPVTGEQGLKADAAVRVARTMASIRRSQGRDKAADATVTGLRLLSVSQNQDQVEISVLISLLDGNSFSVIFEV